MKQMKEDAEKSKQFELRKNKEMALLRKEQIKKEGIIRTLENQKRQKDMVLKRKTEEVGIGLMKIVVCVSFWVCLFVFYVN
jgi:kinesin family protein 4/21/27